MLWLLLTVFRLCPFPTPALLPFGEVAFVWRLAGHQSSCGKLHVIAFALLLVFCCIESLLLVYHAQSCRGLRARTPCAGELTSPAFKHIAGGLCRLTRHPLHVYCFLPLFFTSQSALSAIMCQTSVPQAPAEYHLTPARVSKKLAGIHVA